MRESRLFKLVYHLLDKGRTTASELADKNVTEIEYKKRGSDHLCQDAC